MVTRCLHNGYDGYTGAIAITIAIDYRRAGAAVVSNEGGAVGVFAWII